MSFRAELRSEGLDLDSDPPMVAHAAQRLRPCAVALLDFLSRYGAAPLSALPASSLTSASPPAAQNPPQMYSAIPLDKAVNDALDAFGIGALGDP
jgi:hypothetical protein